jgi:malate dehydrogenase (oxaloacetate-decarboxylating)
MLRPTWRDGSGAWHTTLRGAQVLADPRLNKGTAFDLSERRQLGLVGLLPPRVLTLDDQATRAYAQYRSQPDDLAKHVALSALHDRNEVLFYRVLTDHLAEMLPVVYTPTIGVAIERYSHLYNRPRGVYLSIDDPGEIRTSLAATGLGPDDVDILVATDAQAILGIGDWGVGGMAIAVGKLAVYTAAGGIAPSRTIPVMLDVGTDRTSLLEDPLYLGRPQRRPGPEAYDDFVDQYIRAARELFPNALLHWEDLGPDNARRVLDRYRPDMLTFNDDLQGTGAVNLAAVLSAVRATGTTLSEHRIVIFGAGTAGTGIADQLCRAMTRHGLDIKEAVHRIWLLDRQGLLTDDWAGLAGFQRRYARAAASVSAWRRDPDLGGIGLDEVVRQVHPSVLIGTSTRRGAFTEAVVREMAAHVARPVILPMSNPTTLAEATPGDLLRWSDGRALVATGSPFPPVTYAGVTYAIGQANNALIFPGLGLGTIASAATRVTDAMLEAAAHAVAGLVHDHSPGASLLPEVADLRRTSAAVAVAVARAAIDDGVARRGADDLEERVRSLMWQPSYRPILAD